MFESEKDGNEGARTLIQEEIAQVLILGKNATSRQQRSVRQRAQLRAERNSAFSHKRSSVLGSE